MKLAYLTAVLNPISACLLGVAAARDHNYLMWGAVVLLVFSGFCSIMAIISSRMSKNQENRD
jgi:hypothetical protein